jgi:hypothetical protein
MRYDTSHIVSSRVLEKMGIRENKARNTLKPRTPVKPRNARGNAETAHETPLKPPRKPHESETPEETPRNA